MSGFLELTYKIAQTTNIIQQIYKNNDIANNAKMK